MTTRSAVRIGWIIAVSALAGCTSRLPLVEDGGVATDQGGGADLALRADLAVRVDRGTADGGAPGVDRGATDAQAPADLRRADASPPSGLVTVTTDRLIYALYSETVGTVHNGLKEPIYLPGCAVLDRQHLQGGAWQDRGPTIMCGWEGVARKVEPGSTLTETTSLSELGMWRLKVVYGTGCAPNKPLSGAGCARTDTAVSPPVEVEVQTSTCEFLQREYQSKVQQARRCVAKVGSNSCLDTVQGGLPCGCPVYVANQALMKPTIDKWSSFGCAQLVPPCAVKCAPPAPASCVQGICTP
ncbi:MAG: hypothetical protein IT371_20105 [Deltaproteobacteria bacterium]|nr:hypothetical protein [Deltaproteobacteria bacterium]